MATIDYPTTTDTRLTPWRGTISFAGTNYSYRVPVKKEETRQEKLNRISLAKHYASMVVFNEIRPKIIQVKQMCKPYRRICY